MAGARTSPNSVCIYIYIYIYRFKVITVKMGGQPSSGFSIWISMGGGERSKSKIMSFSLSSQLSWKKKVEKSLDKKKKEHAQVILPVTYPPFDNFANALYPFFERLP